MCLRLCTASVYNTTQHSSDNLPSYLQTNIIAQMLSVGGQRQVEWKLNVTVYQLPCRCVCVFVWQGKKSCSIGISRQWVGVVGSSVRDGSTLASWSRVPVCICHVEPRSQRAALLAKLLTVVVILCEMWSHHWATCDGPVTQRCCTYF